MSQRKRRDIECPPTPTLWRTPWTKNAMLVPRICAEHSLVSTKQCDRFIHWKLKLSTFCFNIKHRIARQASNTVVQCWKYNQRPWNGARWQSGSILLVLRWAGALRCRMQDLDNVREVNKAHFGGRKGHLHSRWSIYQSCFGKLLATLDKWQKGQEDRLKAG